MALEAQVTDKKIEAHGLNTLSLGWKGNVTLRSTGIQSCIRAWLLLGVGQQLESYSCVGIDVGMVGVRI